MVTTNVGKNAIINPTHPFPPIFRGIRVTIKHQTLVAVAIVPEFFFFFFNYDTILEKSYVYVNCLASRPVNYNADLEGSSCFYTTLSAAAV